MTKGSTTTGPPSPSTSSSCFLGCFGCFSEKTRLKEEVNSGRRRRGRRWISSFKKSPTKTVPVDLTIVNDAPTTSNASWEIQVVEENATMTVERKQELKTYGEQKGRRKKQITGSQKETKLLAATSSSGPSCIPVGPKTVITHPFVSSPLKPLTHSKPLPLTKRQKPSHDAHAASGVGRVVLHRTTPSNREFDSIIGVSIILVILVTLVLWGKLCAILCTSAWFFIARHLVTAGDTTDKSTPEGHSKLDLESEEYKKKVILEGLLQRNHRKLSVGRL